MSLRLLTLGAGLSLVASCHSPSKGPAADKNVPDAAVDIFDGAALPDAESLQADLSVDLGRAVADMSLGTEVFSQDSCALDAAEMCVGGPGARQVLRFSVETTNLGNADIALGPPAENEGFEFSACHGHFHFDGFATYRLIDSESQEVLAGRKQAFCLLDSEKYTADAASTKTYHCNNQGLSRGWADVYAAHLPCQFLDVTDLPNGSYELEVTVNPEGFLSESNPDNNTKRIPVVLGNPDLATPTELCPDLGTRYLDRLERECEWQSEGSFACEPGALTSAGCSANCGMGSCTGDPMLRVCDALTENCTAGIALAANNDRCGSDCPSANDFLCPGSGQVEVFSASFRQGQPYSCDLVVGSGPPISQ